MAEWTDSQLAAMYRFALTGCPHATIADGLGVPASAVSAHLSRVRARDQLAWLLDRAKVSSHGVARPLDGLDVDALDVPDLIATADAYGSARARRGAQTVMAGVDRLRGLLALDVTAAVATAEVIAAREELVIAQRRAADARKHLAEMRAREAAR